jgi:type VI secretion system secreted protein Hcp
MTRRLALVLTLLAGLLAMASPAYADDVFLQVADPAIRGESVARGFEGAIEVQAFAWGVQTTPGGRPTFSSLFITKAVDRSSPALMASLASGTHLRSARVTLRTAGAEPRIYLEYCIEDVTVVSQQAGGQASARPTETIGLEFTRFAQRYSYFDSTGARTGEETSGWDTRLNAPAPFLATCGTP